MAHRAGQGRPKPGAASVVAVGRGPGAGRRRPQNYENTRTGRNKKAMGYTHYYTIQGPSQLLRTREIARDIQNII